MTEKVFSTCCCAKSNRQTYLDDDKISLQVCPVKRFWRKSSSHVSMTVWLRCNTALLSIRRVGGSESWNGKSDGRRE